MTKDEFLELYPPPNRQGEKEIELDWQQLQTITGFSFPEEFRFLINMYGTVSLDYFITIFNPFSDNDAINFDAMKGYSDSYLYLQNLFPDTYKRPEGAFVTWAVTDNGDTLFWDTGLPDNENGWFVGIHDKSQSEEEVFSMTTLEFLHCLASGKLSSSILPLDYLTSIKKLVPVSPL